MKKLAISAVVSMMFLAAGYSLAAARTFTGEIYDSQCAKMGSHEMMVKEGMPDKASKANDPTVKAECTKACVKMGGKYVLYDPAKKAVYQLDDQQKSEKFAGQEVKVTGTYDKTTKTIHVTNIKAAP